MNVNTMATYYHLRIYIIAVFVSVVYGHFQAASTAEPEGLGYPFLGIENNANPCDSWGCNNVGVCKRFGTAAWCICSVGYTGDHCEYSDSDTCDNFCVNGGTCHYIGTFTYCVCPTGYSGERCESKSWDKFYDWGVTSEPVEFPKLPVDDVDWNIPTWPPYHDDTGDTTEYIEEGSITWIAVTTSIAIMVLGLVCGMMHYIVRQRRRRLILIRTVQVRVTEDPSRSLPPSLRRQPLFPGLSRHPIRCLTPRIHQGVTIPPQYATDVDPLVSPAAPLMDNDESDSLSNSQFSSVPPSVMTGAPPPYTQVVPQEGNQSIDEPPPPYPGPN